MPHNPRTRAAAVVALAAALVLGPLPERPHGGRADAEEGAERGSRLVHLEPNNRGPRGYWMAAADGGTFAFGEAPFAGSAGGQALGAPVAAIAPAPTSRGYWMAAADGSVHAFGTPHRGSLAGTKPARPVVGMAATPAGQGYWLVASDGGVFTFGDAAFAGSLGATALNQPITGMAPTPTGRGYWLVAADGGIFAFGDAVFAGSTGNIRLNQPVVGMAPTPTGRGYWLVASDGGIFAFGDAVFHGSTGAIRLNQPVVGGAATPSGRGYWLVASDGGIFAFGDAVFSGSTGAIRLNSPIVGMAAAPNPARMVSIFYYPWYGTPERDGAWKHWEQGGHNPPEHIGANFYPERGVYSSSDASVTDSHMENIRLAAVDGIVVSWWGRGSFEDAQLAMVKAAAERRGLTVAIHLEPYGGRNISTVEADLAYLMGLGITDFYVYRATTIPAADWAALNSRLTGVRVLANSSSVAAIKRGDLVRFAAAGRFEGLYTYDPAGFSGSDFSAICAHARAEDLICSPSVAPGYDARRATTDTRVRGRSGGAYYDGLFQGAINAGAEIISITSYNEWHEGTQIELAMENKCLPGGYCYSSYSGDYGLSGPQARGVYIARTAHWVARYK